MFQAPKKPQRPLPPEDTHIARVYQIVELGTHTEEIQGESKTRRLIRLGFELPEATCVFAEGEEARPFVVSKEYSFSMHKKSSLRPVVEAIRGKFKDDGEANDFNLQDLIGAGCFITVEQKQAKGSGNKYANISGIAKLPKTTEVPAAINKPVVYHTSQGKGGAFESLPDFLKEQIITSPEFKAAQ
jgi:hypothetical protein